MEYKYCADSNFEDYACGRVIYHKTGMPSFPVRLADEVFHRSLEYTGKGSNITLYDPCCGGGYMLTVLGLLNPDVIGRIIGSDINEDAVLLAQNNLSLLTMNGLLERKKQIREMIQLYNKQSHRDALASIEKFMSIIESRSLLPDIQCFTADVLNEEYMGGLDFNADIVIADVPYGNLVSWSDSTNAINLLLDSIYKVIHNHSIIAISFDKSQKIQNAKYKRLERLKLGKRIVEILKPAE